MKLRRRMTRETIKAFIMNPLEEWSVSYLVHSSEWAVMTNHQNGRLLIHAGLIVGELG